MKRTPTSEIALLVLFLLVLGAVLSACGSASEPEDRVFDLTISEDALEPEVIKVNQGDTVTLNVRSDKEGALHVHGYNEVADVAPEAPGTVQFTADATGRFSLVLHVSAEEPNGEKIEGEEAEGEHEGGEDKETEGGHEEGEHQADEVEITLGALEVQPR